LNPSATDGNLQAMLVQGKYRRGAGEVGRWLLMGVIKQ